MENEFHWQKSYENDYVIIELYGQLSDGSLFAVSKQLQDSPEYKPGMSEIWVVTSADFSEISPELIAEACKELEEMWEGYVMSKIAVVSEKSLNMGHVSLFNEFYGRDIVQAFDTLDKAEKWLAE